MHFNYVRNLMPPHDARHCRVRECRDGTRHCDGQCPVVNYGISALPNSVFSAATLGMFVQLNWYTQSDAQPAGAIRYGRITGHRMPNEPPQIPGAVFLRPMLETCVTLSDGSNHWISFIADYRVEAIFFVSPLHYAMWLRYSARVIGRLVRGAWHGLMGGIEAVLHLLPHAQALRLPQDVIAAIEDELRRCVPAGSYAPP